MPNNKSHFQLKKSRESNQLVVIKLQPKKKYHQPMNYSDFNVKKKRNTFSLKNSKEQSK
jgi:hypothetical protein